MVNNREIQKYLEEKKVCGLCIFDFSAYAANL